LLKRLIDEFHLLRKEIVIELLGVLERVKGLSEERERKVLSHL
jgi:hypothetical protein